MWWEPRSIWFQSPMHFALLILSPSMYKWHGPLVPRCMASFLTVRRAYVSFLEEVRLWPSHSFSTEWFHFCWLHTSGFPIKFHLSKVFQSKIKPNQTGTNKPVYWPWDQETSEDSPIKTEFSSLLSHQPSVSERLLQCREGSQNAFAALLLCCWGLSTISPRKEGPLATLHWDYLVIQLSLADLWATMS